MSLSYFRKLDLKGRKSDNIGILSSANTSSLEVVDRRILPITYKGNTHDVPVYIVKKLNEKAIAGIDLIESLGICYDPRSKSFVSAVEETTMQNMVHTAQEVFLYPLEARPCKLKLTNWDPHDALAAIDVVADGLEGLYGSEAVSTVFEDNMTVFLLKNCSGQELRIPRGFPVGFAEPVSEISAVKTEEFLDIKNAFPTPMTPELRKQFLSKLHLNVPVGQHMAYEELLCKNHDIFSRSPEDLGKASHFKHTIELNKYEPVYRKQFRIPEQHAEALQKQVKEWLKIGIIEPCHSRYNSAIFAVPKKGGKIRFVLDYRGLNDASLDDRYSMKDINECIGDIGRAESTIFSTMDLTSGFWQLPLDAKSRQLTAFTVPGMGQYQYKVLAMGLKGGPGSFQRMMELTCKGLDKVIVYIDDLIVHTKSHEEHRLNLQKLFHRLRHFQLKLNLDKCFFGSDSVSYLGYRLTPRGILPGSDKLAAIKTAPPPSSLSEVRAFLGLCNFFRSHVNRFATLAAPLIKLTTKEAGWRGPTLPEEARQSFLALKQALVSEPVVQYPRGSLPYELYVDASTGGVNHKGGFGAILAQVDKQGERHVIAYASRALKQHEINYTPYLAEMMCAVWAMQHFGVQLRGRHFTVYSDHKPMTNMNATQTRTYNRLLEALNEFDFKIVYYPGKVMPADYLSRSHAKIGTPPLNVNPINFRGRVTVVDFSQDDIKSAQKNDTFCRELMNFEGSGQLPSDNARATLIKRIYPLVLKQNGVLFRKHVDPVTDKETLLLILPRSLIEEAVHRAHGTLLTGHGGIEKTKGRLLACYYWPNMQQDIREVLKACPKCQLTRPNHPNKEVLHPLPQCSALNQRIHMDLFGPLKTPHRSKAYILCMTDAFTKYVEVALLQDKNSETVCQEVFDKWICRFGVPIQIVTDGGKEFCNKLSTDLYNKLRISHSSTSPYHPQCNAQAEVANKHFQKYLATMCENDTLHWEHLLPPMAFAYNTAVHSTTGLSPYFLTFGVQPNLPGLVPASLDESDNNLRLQALQRARDAAHVHSTEMSNQYKAAHDKKASELVLAPGQQVLLDVRMFTNSNKKLAEKWEGPFFVYQVHPKGVVDILKNNKMHRVNVDRLKPYVAPPPGFEHLGDQSQRLDSDGDASEEDEEAVFFSQVPQMPEMPQPGEPQVQQRRPRGRPRRGEGIPRVPQPYSGPITRSMAQSLANQQQGQVQQISVKKISPTFIRYRDNSEVRQVIANCSYNYLMKAKPELKGKRSLPTPTLHYGDGGACRDEYGIPVTKETLHHPSYLRRRQFFSSLSPSVRNSILTGDPELVFDPIFYEYILSFPQIPFVQDVAMHIEGPDEPPNPPPYPHEGFPPGDPPPVMIGPMIDPNHPYPPDPMDVPLSSWDSSTTSDSPMDQGPPDDRPPPPGAGGVGEVHPQVAADTPFHHPRPAPQVEMREPRVHPDWPHPHKGPTMEDVLNAFDSSRQKVEYSLDSHTSNRGSPAPSVHSFPSVSSSHASKAVDNYPSSHSNSSLSILNSSPSSSLREGVPSPPPFPTYAEITRTPIQHRPLPAIPIKRSPSMAPSWGMPPPRQAVPSHAPRVGPPTRHLGAIPKQPTWKPKKLPPEPPSKRPFPDPQPVKEEVPIKKEEKQSIISVPPYVQHVVPRPDSPVSPRPSSTHSTAWMHLPELDQIMKDETQSLHDSTRSSEFPPPIPELTPMEVLPTPMPRYRQLGWIPAPAGPSPPPVKRFQPSEFSVAPPLKKAPKPPASLPPPLRRSNSDPGDRAPSCISLPSVMTGMNDLQIDVPPPLPATPLNQLPLHDPFRSGRASTVQSPQDFFSVSSESMHSAMSTHETLSSNYAESHQSHDSRQSRSSLSSHSLSSSQESVEPFQRNDSRLSSGTVREVNPDEIVAHPIIDEASEEEEQEVNPPPFWSDDHNAPSFLPEDPSTLPPNVTPHFEDPIGVGEFEGAVMFSGRPIAPVLVPDQSRFREATGSGIPRPGAAANFASPRTQSSSSSSSQSVHSHHSSQSNVIPLPPRAPAALRPATFNPQQQQPPQQQQQPQSRLGQIARRLRGPRKS